MVYGFLITVCMDFGQNRRSNLIIIIIELVAIKKWKSGLFFKMIFDQEKCHNNVELCTKLGTPIIKLDENGTQYYINSYNCSK